MFSGDSSQFAIVGATQLNLRQFVNLSKGTVLKEVRAIREARSKRQATGHSAVSS